MVALSKVAVVRAQYINVTGSLGDHGGVGIELSLALLRAGDPSIDRSSETKAVVTSIFIFNWPTNHCDPALCGMIAGHLPDETLGIKRVEPCKNGHYKVLSPFPVFQFIAPVVGGLEDLGILTTSTPSHRIIVSEFSASFRGLLCCIWFKSKLAKLHLALSQELER